MSTTKFKSELQRVIADQDFIQVRQRQRAAFSPGLAFGRHFCPPFPSARKAAVMAMIEFDQAVPWQLWSIPLTVRPDYLPAHPGQISLPGGSLEPNELPRQAAEREFQEELGLETFPGQTLGELQSLYVYNSDFHVMPFVGCSPPLTKIVPCKREVARLIHLPLGDLCNASSYQREKFSRGDASWMAPTICLGTDRVWGATAIILGELAAVIKHITAA